MNVLVTVASRHGSTREIARVVAEELRAAGLTVEVSEAGGVMDISRYDAVILGSAVYMGNWEPGALRFIDRHQTRLATKPVWLFSSGPLGADDPQPRGDPKPLAHIREVVSPRDHRIFVGKLDSSNLGVGERLIVKIVHAPEGDFREWAAIRDWAREIAAALRPTGHAVVGHG
jgi:menaquinone-dependent protoporphyrinogen oxidase